MTGLWTLNPDAMPFQYSVGDADSKRLNVNVQDEYLSILRWRCHIDTVLEELCRIRTFNTPLEMPHLL